MARTRITRRDPKGRQPSSLKAERDASRDIPRIDLRIPAVAEHVKIARLAAAGVASRMRFTFDEIEDIKLAVAEACNNAILHARLPDSHRVPATWPAIEISFTPHPDCLEISVADEGVLPSPELCAPRLNHAGFSSLDLPEDGLGLLLIRTLMDEVEHHAGPQTTTTVRMIKRLQPLHLLHEQRRTSPHAPQSASHVEIGPTGSAR